MGEIRRRFHDEMRFAELQIQSMGEATVELFKSAMDTVAGHDPSLCETVIASDDKIDEYYMDIETRIIDLFALQSPVASDLRLLTSLLHMNLHLERIGDMAVNIAKISELAYGLPRNEEVQRFLQEMGTISARMVLVAMEAFARRDIDLCRKLPLMDEPIDALNRGMLEHILEFNDDKALLEWGIRMHVVSRQIERVGDHAVDIGEQVAFLITGEFKEFTDASHPGFDLPDSDQ